MAVNDEVIAAVIAAARKVTEYHALVVSGYRPALPSVGCCLIQALADALAKLDEGKAE